MKKGYLVTIILTFVLLTISCAPKPIPPSAIDEIYALGEDAHISKYVEVKEVQDREDYCYIMVYVKSTPEGVTNLEDAYTQAELFTETLAESAVKIFNGYNINKDVAVWAQLPLREGGVTVLGHAAYNARTDSYDGFERYNP